MVEKDENDFFSMNFDFQINSLTETTNDFRLSYDWRCFIAYVRTAMIHDSILWRMNDSEFMCIAIESHLFDEKENIKLNSIFWTEVLDETFSFTFTSQNSVFPSEFVLPLWISNIFQFWIFSFSISLFDSPIEFSFAHSFHSIFRNIII